MSRKICTNEYILEKLLETQEMVRDLIRITQNSITNKEDNNMKIENSIKNKEIKTMKKESTITNNNEANRKEIRILELCAGIGVTSIALERALKKCGLSSKVVGMSEIDKAAIKGYNLLHKDVPNLGDLTQCHFQGMKCDILLATTPCNNLSTAGNQTGFDQKANNSSSIIWEVPRVLEELDELPQVIFFENVKNMVTKKNKKTFERFKRCLEGYGYHVNYKVLDSANHGVPQHRERVFILATLKNIPFEFPKGELLQVKLKDILEKDVEEKYYLKNKDYFINHSLETGFSFRVHNPSYATLAHTITTKSGSRVSDNFIFEKDVSTSSEVVFRENKLMDYDIEELRKVRIRKLTPREVMTLMGLNPKEMMKLSSLNDTQIFKVMGNAIVIPLLEKVFDNFVQAYYENEISELKKVA